jgi:hypothetical protein
VGDAQKPPGRSVSASSLSKTQRARGLVRPGEVTGLNGCPIPNLLERGRAGGQQQTERHESHGRSCRAGGRGSEVVGELGVLVRVRGLDLLLRHTGGFPEVRALQVGRHEVRAIYSRKPWRCQARTVAG